MPDDRGPNSGEPTWHGDVVILGAGFGGSLLALILQRLGLRPLLVDRGAHPRFAIGESSTPIANFLWAKLCDEYGLARLRPLAEYGSWQRSFPNLPCGLKRGFSYVPHQPETQYQPAADHHNELLVAASAGAEDADTHWLRADFDALIATEAVAAGVPLWEQTDITHLEQHAQGWRLAGQHDGQGVEIHARFLIDATGEGQLTARTLGLRNRVSEFHTYSRAVFAHFRNLPPWRAVMQQPASYAEHPYPIDDAALHHLFPEGWMWQLPFNNGVTSAGFSIQRDFTTGLSELSPAAEFQAWLQRYPSLRDQFRNATPCNAAGIIRSGRLQRWLSPAAGANWALLPTTAAFLDPLHSTGNAHTLLGIDRLARYFTKYGTACGTSAGRGDLAEYDQHIQREAAHIDRIVHSGFFSLPNFELFAASSMLYFTAAIWSEHLRHSGGWDRDYGFLLANHPDYAAIVQRFHQRLRDVQGGAATPAQQAELVAQLREDIAPYNLAGLLDPAKQNLYPYPEVKRPSATTEFKSQTGN